VLQCGAVDINCSSHLNVYTYDVMCCSVVQSVAEYCLVLQCVAVCCSVVQLISTALRTCTRIHML